MSAVDKRFESKLQQPKFHSHKAAEEPLPQAKAPPTKEAEKRFLDTMNGLDLELGQSQQQWRKARSPERQAKRGDYLESLDLNIGFESIKKLQDDWCKP
jgi:hypothetical protein